MDQFDNAQRTQNRVRTVLFSIIVITLPLYCLGLLLWVTAPQNPNAVNRTATATETLRPATLTPTLSGSPSITPIILPTNGLPNTPTQLLPPTFLFPSLTPTTFIFPTLTLAPTLTLFPPTNTPTATSTATATWTFLPPATSTPTATSTFTATIAISTDTPTATWTETPTDTVIPAGP